MLSKTRFFLALGLALLFVAGCSPSRQAVVPIATKSPMVSRSTIEASATHTARPSATAADTAAPSPTRTPTVTPTLPPSATPTITATPAPTDTPTITPTPTPIVLGAIVNTTAQCRYGPGRAYLYKLGLEVGDILAVIGRNPRGTWAQVTPIDREFPCWVSAELIDIQGDIMEVERTYTWLPKSPFYGPLQGVRARKAGGQVTIVWEPFRLRKGDDSGQNRYLIEAYTCVGSDFDLRAYSTMEPFITFEDNSGCSQGSYALVYGVEKHGYTPPVRVGWH